MKLWHILFLTLCMSIHSCQLDSKATKSKNKLVGKWILTEGYRGGKKTESLNDTYFLFSDQSMSTNLPIQGATESAYKIEENIISQTIINDLTIDYTIEELTSEELKLSTNLRGLDFLFVLKRHPQ